ncbi:unnamed protein product, partial [Staurois parvus]
CGCTVRQVAESGKPGLVSEEAEQTRAAGRRIFGSQARFSNRRSKMIRSRQKNIQRQARGQGRRRSTVVRSRLGSATGNNSESGISGKGIRPYGNLDPAVACLNSPPGVVIGDR